MTQKGRPTAPWDKAGRGPAPEDLGGAEVEGDLDFGPEHARKHGDRSPPRLNRAAPPAPLEQSRPPQSPKPTKGSFWAAPAPSRTSIEAVADDFLTPLDQDTFDPATGWDFPAVSEPGEPVPEAPEPAPEGPQDPEPTPFAAAAPPAPTPVWTTPDPSVPLEEAELPHPAAAAERFSDPFSEPGDDSPAVDEAAAIATWEQEAAADADDRSADLASISFDPEGFFSIADAPAPSIDTSSDVLAPSQSEPEPVYEVDVVEDESEPEVSSPVVQLEASGEFEFHIDESTAALPGDIFSQSELPAMAPDLALLPVDEAIVHAQKMFRSNEAAMGMAVLEAARFRAPDDDRIATWLKYGERRLMGRYCPSARMDSVPVLLHDKHKLLPVTGGDQRALVEQIDGVSTLSELRSRLPHVPVVGFWKDVGKLVQRGWLGWAPQRR